MVDVNDAVKDDALQPEPDPAPSKAPKQPPADQVPVPPDAEQLDRKPVEEAEALGGEQMGFGVQRQK